MQGRKGSNLRDKFLLFPFPTRARGLPAGHALPGAQVEAKKAGIQSIGLYTGLSHPDLGTLTTLPLPSTSWMCIGGVFAAISVSFPTLAGACIISPSDKQERRRRNHSGELPTIPLPSGG